MLYRKVSYSSRRKEKVKVPLNCGYRMEGGPLFRSVVASSTERVTAEGES